MNRESSPPRASPIPARRLNDRALQARALADAHAANVPNPKQIGRLSCDDAPPCWTIHTLLVLLVRDDQINALARRTSSPSGPPHIVLDAPTTKVGE
jgi:hypothetical protein